MEKAGSICFIASAGYQVSPVTQRLQANSPIGWPQASIETAIRCAMASSPWGEGSLVCGAVNGCRCPGMPGPRRKVWKWPCSTAPSRWAW
ncbi:hypothetical protein D3C78_1499990 [compost metagenome]